MNTCIRHEEDETETSDASMYVCFLSNVCRSWRIGYRCHRLALNYLRSLSLSSMPFLTATTPAMHAGLRLREFLRNLQIYCNSHFFRRWIQIPWFNRILAPDISAKHLSYNKLSLDAELSRGQRLCLLLRYFIPSLISIQSVTLYRP